MRSDVSKATTHVEDVDKHEGSDIAQPQIGAVKMVTLITRMATLTANYTRDWRNW